MRRILIAIIAAAALSALAGCASAPNKRDPLEPFNRAMFSFNEGLDDALFRPVVKVYTNVVPDVLRTGVANFFSNLGDLWTGVNNLLQGKPDQAVSDVGRVLINSTIGMLGLFDFASDMGLQRHNEDFGQTLGRWGVGGGAYVVLPIFGPRTVRDSFGMALDLYVYPVGFVRYVPTRNTLWGVGFLDTRANLQEASNLLDEAAIDRYTFVRESYLQRRRNQIYDGDPPPLPPSPNDNDEPAGAETKPAPVVPPAPGAQPEKRAETPAPTTMAKEQPRAVAYPFAVPEIPDVIDGAPAASKL
jgi:phospholipid-binding lipoprotein MlaA